MRIKIFFGGIDTMAKKATKKVFSKAEWLKSANADLAAGVLTQREIDDACEIWVNALDGKTADEIAAGGGMALRDDWFIDVGDDGGGDV
ncbi:MAG: hypothetical protein NC548_44305 [Lachnospiraceae bacterium]|nr:hypothetical protein [Lachnospiraceae bacterium]